MRSTLFALSISLALPVSADAQCRVPTESNEARLLYFYAVPLAFSAPVRLAPVRAGEISIGGDLTYVPKAPSSIQRTSLCYNPPKNEASDLSPVFPRPRIAIGLPFGLVAEVSYLPPLTVAGATPNLFSASLSTGLFPSLFAATPLRLLLRGHVTVGKVEGAITCSREMLQQSSSGQPCWGKEPSKDTYNPNILGIESALSFGAPLARAGGYLGAGANMLDPRFQVGFRFQDGVNVDTTRVQPVKKVARAVLMAGGWFRVISRLDAGVQVYSVPQDQTVLRVGASYHVR